MILEATIDPVTRGISFKDELLTGETDIDVLAVQFTCPNDIGIDTDLYDMNIKIRYANARKELSTFYVVSKQKSGDNVIFEWKLNEPASRYDGTLYFNVTAEYYSGTTLTKRWNTQMYPIEVFKTLDEGDEQPTVEELSEFEILLNQLSGTVTDMSSLRESMEESAAAITTLTAEGDGTVTLSGLSDPTAVGEWYEEYVKSAKWLKGKTAIPANADLDSYTTIGNYYAPSAEIASSLNSTPITTSAFGLTVERVLADGSYIRQLASNAADVGLSHYGERLYVRRSTTGGTTWTQWYEYHPCLKVNSNATLVTQSDFTIDYLLFNRIGHVVQVKITGKTVSGYSNTWVTVGSGLPVPVRTMYWQGPGTASGDIPYRVRIDMDGNIALACSISGMSTTVDTFVTYLTP